MLKVNRAFCSLKLGERFASKHLSFNLTAAACFLAAYHASNASFCSIYLVLNEFSSCLVRVSFVSCIDFVQVPWRSCQRLRTLWNKFF